MGPPDGQLRVALRCWPVCTGCSFLDPICAGRVGSGLHAFGRLGLLWGASAPWVEDCGHKWWPWGLIAAAENQPDRGCWSHANHSRVSRVESAPGATAAGGGKQLSGQPRPTLRWDMRMAVRPGLVSWRARPLVPFRGPHCGTDTVRAEREQRKAGGWDRPQSCSLAWAGGVTEDGTWESL